MTAAAFGVRTQLTEELQAVWPVIDGTVPIGEMHLMAAADLLRQLQESGMEAVSRPKFEVDHASRAFIGRIRVRPPDPTERPASPQVAPADLPCPACGTHLTLVGEDVTLARRSGGED